MTRFYNMLTVAAILAVAGIVFAQQLPTDYKGGGGGASGSVQGEVQIATTEPDTIVFAAASHTYGDVTVPAKARGLTMKAMKPFRYRVSSTSIESDAILYQTPVDTVYQSGAIGDFSIEYPCVEVVRTYVDTLFVTPTTSDTVWVRAIY